MKVNKVSINANGYPELLQQLSSPPKELFALGNLDELLLRPRVAVVGSRKVSPYGRSVTAQLAGELAGQGVVIISGLALGVDAIAHQAALDAGGLTLAVPPGPVGKIYPSSHTSLHDGSCNRAGHSSASTQPARRRSSKILSHATAS